MDDNNSHFRIPNDNIRNEKYEVTGGGANYTRTDHVSHGQRLFRQTTSLRRVESQKKDFELVDNLFIQVKSPKDFPIKNGKLKLEQLGFELIDYSAEDDTAGIAKISKAEFDELDVRITKYFTEANHPGKSYFSVLEEIKDVPLETKIKNDIDLQTTDPIDIVFNLYNTITRREQEAIVGALLETLSQIAENIQVQAFENSITSIACRIEANNIASILDHFSTIKEIRQNYVTFVENSFPIQRLPNPLGVSPPITDSRVCIIDSGVFDNCLALRGLVTDRLVRLPPGAIVSGYDHGTFVASRCLFGDNIDSCIGSHSLQPYCTVVDVSVFGLNAAGSEIKPNEYHLRTVVQEVVRTFHQTAKVYNLSLGSNLPIKSYLISDLAKLIDYLSKEYKVLFVISSGNINDPLGAYPVAHFDNVDARICCPSESLLSLTVGSIAKFIDTNSIALFNEVSPFSRIGPGCDNGMKPELVAHGGNLIAGYAYSPRISTYGISADGTQLAVNIGTSFSAPLISQYAARLFSVYPASGPNLIKALLCHFSEARNTPSAITTNKIFFTGFGEPIIDSAILAGPNSAAYLYEGKLSQQHYQYIGFHIPSVFSSGAGDARLRIKITIVYDPKVNPTNDKEYSQCRVSATLLKNTTGGLKTVTIDSDDKYLQQWNPILQMEKEFIRSFSSGSWELKLRLFTRDQIPAGYEQDYAAIIEIQDASGNANVHNEITDEFAGIYQSVDVRKAA